MINLDNIDAVDKWIDLHYQVVWSILFVLAGVRLQSKKDSHCESFFVFGLTPWGFKGERHRL